jgi:hypothetical protein
MKPLAGWAERSNRTLVRLDRETHRWANRSTFIIVAALFLGVTATVALLVARSPDSGSVKPGGTQPVWTEVKWPFPIDQWGTGKAFTCNPVDCGSAISLYLRAKIGFCNCATGVADDDELERVSDVDLLGSPRSVAGPGRQIAVARMLGRSRPYAIGTSLFSRTSALAIAFNNRCDVIVATALVGDREPTAAERRVMGFLNGDLVLRWAELTLGL